MARIKFPPRGLCRCWFEAKNIGKNSFGKFFVSFDRLLDLRGINLPETEVVEVTHN